MGTSKRYSAEFEEKLRKRLEERTDSPTTLPPAAWGPRPIEWTNGRPPVWVWIQWHDLTARRVKGYVKGHNERVCVVWVEGPGGGWEVVVWRNAVTVRR